MFVGQWITRGHAGFNTTEAKMATEGVPSRPAVPRARVAVRTPGTHTFAREAAFCSFLGGSDTSELLVFGRLRMGRAASITWAPEQRLCHLSVRSR